MTGSGDGDASPDCLFDLRPRRVPLKLRQGRTERPGNRRTIEGWQLGNVIAFRREGVADHQSTRLSMSALPTSLQDVLANWFDLVSDDLGDDSEIMAKLADHPGIAGGHCLVISTARANDPKRWRLLHLPEWMAEELSLSPTKTVFEQFIGTPFLEAVLDQMILCQVSGRPTAVKFFGPGARDHYAYSTVFLPVTNDIGQPILMLVGVSLDIISG